MMGYFPETFNKEERCLLPALSLPFCSLSNCELSNPTSLILVTKIVFYVFLGELFFCHLLSQTSGIQTKTDFRFVI